MLRVRDGSVKREEGGHGCKRGSTRDPGGVGTIQCLDCGGGYRNLHRIVTELSGTYTHTKLRKFEF